MAELMIFIFGAAVGSFLNVVILRLRSGQVCRLESEEGMIKGRSHCPKCGQPLRWYDLIPIASFFMLRGRCRACRESISWQYPLVEIITGALFVLALVRLFPELVEGSKTVLDFATLRLNNILSLFFWFYLISSLIVIFVYDLRHYIIPDIVLFPAIAISFLWQVFWSLKIGHWSLIENWSLVIGHFGPYFFSAFGAAASFLFLVLITKGRGMGLGDVKLALLLGLVLGWPDILLALFLAFFLGALAGLTLILLGRKTMKSQVPFGPFLILGTLVALFWGQGIINFYQSFLIY